MPCNSDYLKPTHLEKEIGKVYRFLDEIAGKKIPKDKDYGQDDRVYSKNLSKKHCDNLIERLCSQLQKLDVSKYSLEMQIWWRDHQKADKDRLQREIQNEKDKKARKAAINKLTDYERKLLGIKEL